MAAPVQRRAIEGERQYFTFRLTRRTVPMTFSMMFVQASERRSSGGSPSFVTVVEPFQDRGGNALPVLFEMPGKVAKKCLGLAGIIELSYRRFFPERIIQ